MYPTLPFPFLRNVLDISSVILDVRAENMQEVAQFVVAKAARGFDAEQQSKVKSGALCTGAVKQVEP